MTARDRTLAALAPQNWVSWKQLRQVGGVRYSARLLELKRLGYQIEDGPDPNHDGKQYRLISPVRSTPQGKLVKLYLEESDVVALINGIVRARASQAAADALRTFQANKHKL